MNVLGWDIGGANLKASDGQTRSLEVPFPLWKQPEDLAAAIQQLASQFEPADGWAVTMTGELADCFATKREGVERILRSVQEAAGETAVAVWTTTGEFVGVDHAVEWPLLTAASNWLALATWTGRVAPTGTALLVDVGSTTTDIIPLVEGYPDPVGRTDIERLQAGELVYTGWKRTPVCAIAEAVTFRGARCPLAAELFATARDVYLVRGDVHESEDCDTANGRPATVHDAQDRLARMLCADREEISVDELVDIAGQLAQRQRQQIASAVTSVLQRLPMPPATIVVSGAGEFLARAALGLVDGMPPGVVTYSLLHVLGREHATAACAFAVSRLAGERVPL